MSIPFYIIRMLASLFSDCTLQLWEGARNLSSSSLYFSRVGFDCSYSRSEYNLVSKSAIESRETRIGNFMANAL
jgi:hypothetical protein